MSLPMGGRTYRLMFKVRNNQGGWGFYARFWSPTDDAPVRDVVVVLSQEPPSLPSQNDADGDGIGDPCDDD